MIKENRQDKLAEESGMITHFKTTNILRTKDWSVLISPFYYDSLSDSIRETDLIAEKQFRLDKNALDDAPVQLNFQLFVECKYIKQEIVFWFDKIDKEKEISYLEKEIGLRLAYGKSGDIHPKEFHYNNEEYVAKLFSTNSNREDIIYKAMNQCLHSQINYRRGVKEPIFKKFSRGVFSHIIQCPVIVCENFDNLVRVNFDNEGKYTFQKMKNHFILEANYREDYFLIDIVDINYLDSFLNILEGEAKSLVESYRFRENMKG